MKEFLDNELNGKAPKKELKEEVLGAARRYILFKDLGELFTIQTGKTVRDVFTEQKQQNK